MKYLFTRLFKIAIIIAIYVIFIIVSLRQPAKSQILDSSFYRWKVYEIQENELEYKKCYIVSRPVNSDTDHNSRQKPYIMISRFQRDRSEEVSVYGGFEFKLNSDVLVMIDKERFRLLAKKDMAWAKTKYDDVIIISTMLSSGVLKVRGDSAVGTYAVDEYSLKGITRAYARMREICK
jgi:hypothetical protein